jgi:tetratricopeptide (TPR) repeat protein
MDPDLLASDCLLALGDKEEARARILRSLRRWPATRDGLARAVAAGLGEIHERRLFALHDAASAHFALARARRAWGDPRGALRDAAALASLVPEAAPLAAFERGLCLLDLGQPDVAVEEYARSLAIGYFVYGSGRFDEPVMDLVLRFPKLEPARELVRRHAARQGRRG